MHFPTFSGNDSRYTDSMEWTVETAVILASVTLAAIWVPIGMYFFRSWQRRRSPLSLAIVGLVAYPVFTNLSVLAFLRNSPIKTVLVLFVANIALLLNFAFCFWLQRTAVIDERRDAGV